MRAPQGSHRFSRKNTIRCGSLEVKGMRKERKSVNQVRILARRKAEAGPKPGRTEKFLSDQSAGHRFLKTKKEKKLGNLPAITLKL
jgi:hypothetical protein